MAVAHAHSARELLGAAPSLGEARAEPHFSARETNQPFSGELKCGSHRTQPELVVSSLKLDLASADGQLHLHPDQGCVGCPEEDVAG
jgi:hypothetical protein